jgi:hypothetical protein
MIIFTETSKTSCKVENVHFIGNIQFMNGAWLFVPNHNAQWMATDEDLISVANRIQSLNSRKEYNMQLLAERVSFLTSLVIRATVEGWTEEKALEELDK